MKCKRGNGKRKPTKPVVVGANEAFLDVIHQHEEDHSGWDNLDNATFDSTMEADTQRNDLQPGLKQQVVNERIEDSTNSLCNTDAAFSGKCSKKDGNGTTKSPRGFGSSRINPSSNAILLQGEGTHQQEPRVRRQDLKYKEQELKAALLVVKKIMKLDAAKPFNTPVNPIALGIPDYFDIIDTPMDFGTICNNLENGLKYQNSEDVFKDVQFIWENCCKYNKKGDYILELMERVKKNFMKLWTAAVLCGEKPQAINGHLHLPNPTESALSSSKHGCMCPEASMTDYLFHHQQDLRSPSQVQHHQLSPNNSHAYQPQQRAFQCQSSSRNLQASQLNAGSYIASAGHLHVTPPTECAMMRNQCGHTCPVEHMDGNPSNKQQNETSPSHVLPHQPHHPQQRSCQCQSVASQLQPSLICRGINICTAEHLHLPLQKECPVSCREFGQVCPLVTMTACHQQQYPMGSSQPLARQPSLSYCKPCQPHQRTCQCHSSSIQPKDSQPEAGPNIGCAESTMRHSKCGLECPVGLVTDSPSHQQLFHIAPSHAQSHQPSSIRNQENQSEQRSCHGQLSSSQQASPPQTIADNCTVEIDSASARRRTRGPTRCLKLWNREGKRISIATNELGQPIGIDAPKLTSFLGTMARDGHMAPLTYVDWRAMPDANKENMWQQVQSKFDIDPKCKSWVMMSLGKKWKDWKSKLKAAHYNTHATDEERLADRDERVLPDQWSILVSRWSSEEGEKLSATNKANRAQQKFNHTTGTKSFARVREEQRAKRPDGKEPSRAELFILTRTRKDGQPVNEASSAVISQLCEQATQQQEETPQNSTVQDDIFFQIMGQDRHGRMRTYGLGPSPSDIWGPKPTRAEAMRMVSQANVEVHEMKQKMVAMEQTFAQMAGQMATMMSMMSSMQRRFPDKHHSDEVVGISNASEGSPQQQVHAPASRHSVSSIETRARKRGKM